MRTDEKRARMFSLVEEWRLSGLPQTVFSNLHGIKVATLRYWIARSRSDSSGKFIALDAQGETTAEVIEIIYPTGVRLKVSRDLALICQLIRL